MNQEECIVCDKMIEFETKFSPDFCDDCQVKEDANGERFKNTSFEELVRYYVELEDESRKVIVNIEELNAIQLRLQEINSLDLANIEFREDGKKLDIPKEVIEEFKFVGLCNHSFIEMDFYLNKSKVIL
jgi:hypothetical protein